MLWNVALRRCDAMERCVAAMRCDAMLQGGCIAALRCDALPGDALEQAIHVAKNLVRLVAGWLTGCGRGRGPCAVGRGRTEFHCGAGTRCCRRPRRYETIVQSIPAMRCAAMLSRRRVAAMRCDALECSVLPLRCDAMLLARYVAAMRCSTSLRRCDRWTLKISIGKAMYMYVYSVVYT